MVGQPVTLTAASGLVDDPPPPLWDLGNTEHRSGNPFVYTYPAAGTFNLILTASEKNCHTTQLVSRTVTVRPRPSCDFSDLPPQLQICCGNQVCDAGEDQSICPDDCGVAVGAGGPYEGSVGEAISFHATVGTPGPVTSYLWHFGDGVSSSAASPTHVYGAPGSYGVNLTVTTAHGTGLGHRDGDQHPCNDNGQCEDGERPSARTAWAIRFAGNGVPDRARPARAARATRPAPVLQLQSMGPVRQRRWSSPPPRT
jgi:PKD repeat protein